MYREPVLGEPGVKWVYNAQKQLDDQAVAEVNNHCARVGQLCYELARIGGYSESQCNRLRWAGFLHDLGKYLIPPDVLFTPEELGPEERDLIRKHPLLGAKKYLQFSMDSSGGYDVEIFSAILQHHERYDGEGYPSGRSKYGIETSAQIVSLSDYVEALTADRCYRKAYPFEEAVEMVQTEAGRAWPSKVANLFLDNQQQCLLALNEPHGAAT